MAQQTGSSIENNFSAGLISDATGLNFPPNACTETENCIFEDGDVTRRPGFDFEFNHLPKAIDISQSAITSFVWKDVSGIGDLSLVVVQVGETLYFYETNQPFGAISQGAIVDTIDLTDFSPAGADSPSLNECQFAQGLGYLFVFHPNLEPFYVAYDDGAQSVTETMIDVQIRDFEGVMEAVAVDDRPAVLTDAHAYNLFNQGWDEAKILEWEAALSNYPSNADVWWFFKNPDEEFDVTTVDDRAPGNSQAPKGHFILSAFDQQRDAISGLTIDDVTTEEQRPSTGVFHAGRVWYTGVNYLGYTGKIYYSQIIETVAQAGYCYKPLDPSSEELFDSLPTDGGVINIPEAGTIIKLWPLSNHLLVFSSAGLWAISGSQGLGFTALDYSISFVSSISALSASSFVDIAGTPVFWSTDGIYAVTINKDGQLQVQSLTNKKIRDFYATIPTVSKKYARGAYNPYDNTAQWIYTSTEETDLTELYTFDSCLVFDTSAGAFYPWRVEESDVKIHSMFISDLAIVNQLEIDNVIDAGGDNVIDASGNQVVVLSNLSPYVAIEPKFKYLVSFPDSGNKITWAEVTNPEDDKYLDWMTYDDGTDYESFFVTGYRLTGQGLRRFQSNYIFMFSDTTTQDLAYRIQCIYDYALSGDTGRWSALQTLTHTSGDYSTSRKKILLRGHGYAVQFKIRSVSGEPFHFIGWAILDTANTAP